MSLFRPQIVKNVCLSLNCPRFGDFPRSIAVRITCLVGRTACLSAACSLSWLLLDVCTKVSVHLFVVESSYACRLVRLLCRLTVSLYAGRLVRLSWRLDCLRVCLSLGMRIQVSLYLLVVGWAAYLSAACRLVSRLSWQDRHFYWESSGR